MDRDPQGHLFLVEFDNEELQLLARNLARFDPRHLADAMRGIDDEIAGAERQIPRPARLLSLGSRSRLRRRSCRRFCRRFRRRFCRGLRGRFRGFRHRFPLRLHGGFGCSLGRGFRCRLGCAFRGRSSGLCGFGGFLGLGRCGIGHACLFASHCCDPRAECTRHSCAAQALGAQAMARAAAFFGTVQLAGRVRGLAVYETPPQGGRSNICHIYITKTARFPVRPAHFGAIARRAAGPSASGPRPAPSTRRPCGRPPPGSWISSGPACR